MWWVATIICATLCHMSSAFCSQQLERKFNHPFTFRAKKQPMQRPASPTYSQRLSPVNSLTFISREQSRVDAEEKEPYQAAPRPLSALYCERMELTLSDLTYRTDSSTYPPFYEDLNRSFGTMGENEVYERTFATENPPPTLEDSDRSGALGGAQDERRNASWGEKTNGTVDNFLENQTSKSQGSGGTDDSSFTSDKHAVDAIADSERYL